MKVKIILSALVLVILCSCGSARIDSPGPFVHSVYFWLKDSDSPAERSKFMESLKTFIDQSPNIRTAHIGQPADTNRDIIDNTYTYSLILTFEDKAAHDRYQVEPAHQVMRDQTTDMWSKIVIYDSESLK